jgi:hypothetical protein
VACPIRRRRRKLRCTDNAFPIRFSTPAEIQKNRQNFHNPNPDTTLRSTEYYSFLARGYASTAAVVTAARPG